MTADEAREIARRKREEIAKLQADASKDVGKQQQQDDGFARITSAFEKTTLVSDEGNGHNDTTGKEEDDPEHLIGFGRLYSGTLSVGDSVYVLPPKFSPAHPHANPEPQKVVIKDLFLLMGRSLEPLDSVPAGVVFGIGGLAGRVLKTGTLCSQLEGSVNLAGVSLSTPPIVRVALEPVNPADLGRMVEGLRLLEQSDPCAQYEVLPSGEHVMLTAGELHLERCLKDLRERFAKCELQAGETMVPYRETITSAPEMAPPKQAELGRGCTLSVSSSKQLSIRLRVVPLPANVTEFLAKHTGTVKRLQQEKLSGPQNAPTSSPPSDGEIEGRGTTKQEEASDAATESREVTVLPLKEFREELEKLFGEVKGDKELWSNVVNQITAFGPRRIGPNILIDSTKVNACEKL